MYARIRRAREDRGYTREAFAEQLDVSVSYLAEVERGRTRISVKMLTQISRVLGLSADYILLGEEATSDRMLLSSIRRIDKKIPSAAEQAHHGAACPQCKRGSFRIRKRRNKAEPCSHFFGIVKIPRL